jgi:hypothetical protein
MWEALSPLSGRRPAVCRRRCPLSPPQPLFAVSAVAAVPPLSAAAVPTVRE